MFVLGHAECENAKFILSGCFVGAQASGWPGNFARMASTRNAAGGSPKKQSLVPKSAANSPADHEIGARFRSHCMATVAGCDDHTYWDSAETFGT